MASRPNPMDPKYSGMTDEQVTASINAEQAPANFTDKGTKIIGQPRPPRKYSVTTDEKSGVRSAHPVVGEGPEPAVTIGRDKPQQLPGGIKPMYDDPNAPTIPMTEEEIAANVATIKANAPAAPDAAESQGVATGLDASGGVMSSKDKDPFAAPQEPATPDSPLLTEPGALDARLDAIGDPSVEPIDFKEEGVDLDTSVEGAIAKQEEELQKEFQAEQADMKRVQVPGRKGPDGEPVVATIPGKYKFHAAQLMAIKTIQDGPSETDLLEERANQAKMMELDKRGHSAIVDKGGTRWKQATPRQVAKSREQTPYGKKANRLWNQMTMTMSPELKRAETFADYKLAWGELVKTMGVGYDYVTNNANRDFYRMMPPKVRADYKHTVGEVEFQQKLRYEKGVANARAIGKKVGEMQGDMKNRNMASWLKTFQEKEALDRKIALSGKKGEAEAADALGSAAGAQAIVPGTDQTYAQVTAALEQKTITQKQAAEMKEQIEYKKYDKYIQEREELKEDVSYEKELLREIKGAKTEAKRNIHRKYFEYIVDRQMLKYDSALDKMRKKAAIDTENSLPKSQAEQAKMFREGRDRAEKTYLFATKELREMREANRKADGDSTMERPHSNIEIDVMEDTAAESLARALENDKDWAEITEGATPTQMTYEGVTRPKEEVKGAEYDKYKDMVDENESGETNWRGAKQHSDKDLKEQWLKTGIDATLEPRLRGVEYNPIDPSKYARKEDGKAVGFDPASWNSQQRTAFIKTMNRSVGKAVKEFGKGSPEHKAAVVFANKNFQEKEILIQIKVEE